MMNLKRISLLAPLFLLFLVISGCRASTGAWEQIKESGVLRIGLDPTYPPFETAADNGLYGLDVDLAEALARDLDLETEFVYFGYDGLYDALATKQVDVLISALVPVPGRMKDFAYSEPYFNAGEILIIRNDNELIQDLEDMDGRRLAVELGAQGHVTATQWAKHQPDLIIEAHNSVDVALAAVVAGEADVALVDSVSGRLYFQTQAPVEKSLRILPEPVSVEPYALVVRIEDEMLLENLNGSIQTLIESGELDQIVNRWLGD